MTKRNSPGDPECQPTEGSQLTRMEKLKEKRSALSYDGEKEKVVDHQNGASGRSNEHCEIDLHRNSPGEPDCTKDPLSVDEDASVSFQSAKHNYLKDSEFNRSGKGHSYIVSQNDQTDKDIGGESTLRTMSDIQASDQSEKEKKDTRLLASQDAKIKKVELNQKVLKPSSSSDVRIVHLSDMVNDQNEKCYPSLNPLIPCIVPRKKLLVLDLNGLLADINQDYSNAHMAAISIRGKLVFKRPFCDDFLSYCFQNFEIGIWSSRQKHNVDSVVDAIMGDLRKKLLFCWDASRCTCTGFKTISNMDKPLVLKELRKLWDKEDDNLPWEKGAFCPSNTLLIDDSPYKALCNPPHTAIFPLPFSYIDREDNFLGPKGDLRAYLDGVAMADDVQSYVGEHPFGQPAISQMDPEWNFYSQVLQSLASLS